MNGCSQPSAHSRPHRRPLPGSRRGESGQSLIHLLTTMAVLSIVAAAARPSVVELMESYKLRSATRQVYDELQRARTSAVMRNTRARVTVTDRTQLIFEIYDAETDAWRAQPTSSDWSDSARFVTHGGSGTFEFQADGSAPSSGLLWLRTASGRTLYVHASAAGQIRIQ